MSAADHVIIPHSKIRIQEKSQWCYAAIAQLVIQHYQKKTIDQSSIVKSVMALATPPTSSKQKDDNQPQDPFDYLNEMNHIRTSVDGSAPDAYIIRSEIDKNRPIIVRIGTPASGHYMLIVGYSDDPRASVRTADSSVSRVFYIDPLKKNYTIESGSNANSQVQSQYEDRDGVTQRAKDHITGYHLTRPAVDSPKSTDSSAVASKKTSPGKSKKTKQGGRRQSRTKFRKSTCKRRYRRTNRR
jgi:hypothetical protein